MRLPGALFLPLLSSVVIALSLVSPPRALSADRIVSRPTSPRPRRQLLVLTPAILGFGRVNVGQRKFQTVTITNMGDTEVTVSEVLIEGEAFALSGLELPLTLKRGERYTFSGLFAPRFRGEAKGSVSFVSGSSTVEGSIPRLEFSGTAVTDNEQLYASPVTVNFGTVAVGSTGNQMGTLIASGSDVTVSSVNISDPSFAVVGLSFPFTIQNGGTQSYTVTFTPQAVGTAAATLSFFTAAGSTLTFQSLIGTGGGTQGHTVNLSWNASTSQDVTGYNVYRGTQSGGPYGKINPALVTSTAYADSSVSGGTTYYYVTTAIDSSGQESAYSNEAQASIP